MLNLPADVTATIKSIHSQLLPVSHLIEAAYLTGSYAYGAAAKNSDIDIVLVTKTNSYKPLIQNVVDVISNQASETRPYDILLVAKDDLVLSANASVEERAKYRKIPLAIALCGELLWGHDMKSTMPPLSKNDYVNTTADVPWHWINRFRKIDGGQPFSGRLSYPDANAEFFGYCGEGAVPPNTIKSVLALYTWIGTAVIAQHSGTPLFSKSVTVNQYAEERLRGHATLTQAVNKIRSEWNYAIPDSPEERSELRDLCKDLLNWERSFQDSYFRKDFQVWFDDSVIDLTSIHAEVDSRGAGLS